MSDLWPRIVAILGEGGARDLLDAIPRPDEERAALIARLHATDEARGG
jgi:hypothetical protein